MTQKTRIYADLNLPAELYGRECDTCGFSLMPHNAKCYGLGIQPDGQRVMVCAVCFQVMTIMNREVLHKGDWLGEKPMGGPYSEMMLIDPSMKRVSIWKVLDHDPWLEQIQSMKVKEEKEREK